MSSEISRLVEDETAYIQIGDEKIYVPHATQWPFHLDAFKWKFRGLFGGTASGKTAAGIAEDAYWSLRFPGIVGYIFEPTYKMIDRIVIPTLNTMFGTPFYEHGAIRDFNRGRMNIVWDNGSILWLGSLDEPEHAEGPNVDFIHVDEARLIKPDKKFGEAWDVIVRRLRGSGGGHPIGCWVTTTPNWPGTFLHNFFEHPKKKDPSAKPYRMHLDDNKDNLPEGYIESVKRRHSGALYDRFVEGKFAGEETATFDFDYTIHVDGFVKPKHGDISFGTDFGWCYSEDTDVLTSRGWLKHNEIKTSDLIATFNPKSDKIIWDKPLGLFQQHYVGEMVEVASRSSNFFVTPHHKCWVGKRRFVGLKFKEVQAKDIIKQRANLFAVKIAAEDNSGEEKQWVDVPYYYCKRRDRVDKKPIVEGDVWLKFIAWFISEGCAVDERRYGVYLIQSFGAKSQMIDEVLKKLPYKVYRQEYINEHDNKEVKWQITCKALNKWLRENCGVHAENKQIPSFIFGVSLRQRRLFIETLIHGDGSFRKKEKRSPIFHSSSEKLLDQVQQLALMSGYASTKSFYKHGVGRVSFMSRNFIYLEKERSVHIKEYSGMIYCLNTNTGYYVTRRRGKPAFQGNTNPFCIIAVLFDGDRRAFVVDEFYKTRLSDVEIINECFAMQKKWGEGTFHCDPSRPDTIAMMKRSRLKVKPGNRNVEEGIMEIGGRFKDAGDGKRRLYVSSACENLIEELQIFNPEQKGVWHGTDSLRYCLLGNRQKRESAWGLGRRLRR